jgi:hypothetical protein
VNRGVLFQSGDSRRQRLDLGVLGLDHPPQTGVGRPQPRDLVTQRSLANRTGHEVANFLTPPPLSTRSDAATKPNP